VHRVGREQTMSINAGVSRAKIVNYDAVSLSKCAISLRQGLLVAFPTETVYGLGGYALDAVAVQSIFTTKCRPNSDPLIVHVPDIFIITAVK